MTRKQKRFADEYLISLNATQSAIKAGYNPNSAYSQGQRMLKNVEVKQYIDEQLEKLHSEKTADAQEVIEYLSSVMRGEHKDQTLQLVGDGVQKISNIEVPAKDRLKAAELLGKRYGIFTEKVQVDNQAEEEKAKKIDAIQGILEQMVDDGKC